ncbi:MAG: site-2 protease family protein [Firmicutes bacterium]|nr:site-2 protease family protein [Bacillota bacterium]
MKFWISPLCFLLAAAMLLLGYGFELVYYLIALGIHELAHAEVAKRRGYGLESMKLTPYGASLTGKFESTRPRDEIIIALAGPLINLVLAVMCIALWWVAPTSYAYTETFAYVNLAAAVFNLLPVFPLDGGRILLAALSIKFPRQAVYRRMRLCGFAAAALCAALAGFALYAGLFNPSLALIAIFFFVSTVFPDSHSKYRRLYSMGFRLEKLKKGLAVKEVMVSPDTKLNHLLRLLNANYFYRFTVTDASFTVLGEITEIELEKLAAEFGGATPAGKAVKAE